MYPTWGNFGGSQPQNFGGSGPRKQPAGGPAAGFGGFEAPASDSLFSSLQEQHRQQMQQLQMLHQKQLQSVLHHGSNANSYGGGGPPVPQQGHQQQPPPPPPLSKPNETQPGPPPPEPPSVKPPENPSAPKAKEATSQDPSLPEEDNPSNLQVMSLLFLASLVSFLKKCIASILSYLCLKPEVPKDPEEAARLQQLQAAAAQWQQVQQQRAGLQYQALMRQHEKLQQVLEQYQQLIQQPEHLQSMSAEMQLRHYEMQQKQFTPLFQDWDRSFGLWHEQFKTYPHKDQLKDYEHQWKQWQEQMNATNAHLQERVATLTAMMPFASVQYSSGMMGQYGQYPGQDKQMQQQSVTPGVQHSPVSVGSRPQGPPLNLMNYVLCYVNFCCPTDFRGNNPRFDQPQQGFDCPPRFDQPQQRFDAPPQFEPRQRFDGPPRFDQPRQRFDGPPRFDQPRQRFDGPPRFDQPRQRFDGPPRFDQPRQHFDGPPRFDQPRQRFDGPPRFDQPRFGQQPRFDQPPRPPGPMPRFERPPVPQQKQQQGPQPKADPANKEPTSIVSNTSGKSTGKPQTEKEKKESEPNNKANAEDMTDDNLLGNGGFFVQNDPIPQTLQPNTTPEKPDAKNNSSTQKPIKAEGPISNNKPQVVQKPPGMQQGQTSSGQVQSRQDPAKPPIGRGRGQPPAPVTPLGRGRGQIGGEEFRGPNTEPLGENIVNMSYDYMQSEETYEMPEQEEYQWEDPSYEEFGGGEEVPPEEMWMPEDHHFQTEEEYYEEPIGGPYMGRGRPPFPPGRGRPPRGHPGFMHPGRGRPPHPPHGPMDHDPLGRGRRRVPPPPHEMLDSMEEPLYDKGMEGELGWEPPHGRGPPGPPTEMVDSGRLSRRPIGRGMARGMWRSGPTHEEFEDQYKEGYVEDYGHGEGGHRWRPPTDYPPEDLRHEAKYRESEWDREGAPLERDYPPRKPPPEPYRDSRWLEERERDRGPPFPYDEHDRGRGELRIREYRDEPPYPPLPPASEWDRSSRHPPLPERVYPADFEDRRPRYEEPREGSPLDRPPPLPPAAPATNLPESSVDLASQGSSGANVLALSQRQHEIILKAAQELKLIRELQEGKTEPQPAPADILPELPAGLLGLEIPADVRNVLKPASWNTKPAITEYQTSLPAAPTLQVIPKTVDYGHGHGRSTTVERMSYGERIVLRPDPVQSDRGYEKGEDLYSRDPYYDRRSDPYMERRDYSRERELYREKLPPEYERERYERERYPPRDRDERSPLAPSLRPGYRERDRDIRERERSDSRDRDEHYGRPGYDRPPYERTGHDRSGAERYGHSSSPYVDRRTYPEERVPSAAPALPPPPQPPPRVEKKPEIKNIDDLLKPPGRSSRPERIVIIMRGLPGSGKSHVAKLIRDKEVDCGGAPPRVLVLDDYFMTEVEKVEKDRDTGKRVKSKVLEYEYEPEMEDTYRNSMLKTFKKTLDDGFFPFIILDTINDRVKHFDTFWSAAKTKGFEVYLAEISADTQTCSKRNVHGRTLKDIMKVCQIQSLTCRVIFFNTDKLDGLGSSGKRKREDMAGMDHFLQLPDDYATRMSEPGKKRVRWADLEEQKEADRKRAIGFVVGQTDWERITDESGELAQRALNRTKYF
uniref:YLP motif-containing protein 1 n=1 Tax=Labrus bergylta TaxID=56723 RepID=A0A3Q3H1H1_9LABR